MSERDNLRCAQCSCTEAFLWKSVGEKQHMCNDCFEHTKNHTKQETDGSSKAERSKLRKSTRSTRYNGKNGTASNNLPGPGNTNSNKTNNIKSTGRGRRSLFRRPPMKSPIIPASTHHVNMTFYKVDFTVAFKI